MAASHEHQNFNPYLAGFDGMYCLKLQRPRNGTNVSSTVTYSYGMKGYDRCCSHRSYTAPIGAHFDCCRRVGLVFTISNRRYFVICSNLQRGINWVTHCCPSESDHIARMGSSRPLYTPIKILTPLNLLSSSQLMTKLAFI